MTNHEKLRELMADVFLISPSEFRPDLRREEVDTWDSLGLVSLALAVDETFGYHMTQDEAVGVQGVPDLVRVLESHGIEF
jgi:acyl carrier protein